MCKIMISSASKRGIIVIYVSSEELSKSLSTQFEKSEGP